MTLATTTGLRARLERLSAEWQSAGGAPSDDLVSEVRAGVAELLGELESGSLRAAEPDADAVGGWRVNAWVKQGILLAFRLPELRDYRAGDIFAARDRAAVGVVDLLDGAAARAAVAAGAPIRVVPGGTTVRAGAHLEPGVTIVPPAFVNVGAWVGRGSMVDSHALVGSCAQVGERVHLSAAVQVGGVLEPAGARPVIVEDDAFIGGGCGLYEGVVVGRGAVLGAGVILTGQGRLVDLVDGRELRGTPDAPLRVPDGSVVVPGSRPAAGAFAAANGIAVAVPVIVKRRDASTDARTALEGALR
ncbi:MAG: 2,3,4,5-tetrahydropyridine-2,6-dicarboxylate N-succinyltransferase [Chloroflexota bacterium]|jgi:2,3,4,5-tetrahydropyridine-2-carboxylate N-succinyltransferase|nr:2,3,4,5-tetrahydropyridine-2,6-dicarboxylate N-succinyltransferase [Chloroflexota bacterium]